MGKLIDRFKNPRTVAGKWLLNVFLACDQMINALRGGDPDETISSDLGKDEIYGTLNRRENRLARFLNRIDKNHCQNAIEQDEGKDSLKNFSGA
jgi:hypothetical protein